MDVREQIREILSIEDVALANGLSISRNGRMLCPFHDDHNPSASVKDGWFRCWACGDSSMDIFDFTMKLRGESFREALEYLADLAGVPLQGEYQKPREDSIIVISREVLKKIGILNDAPLRGVFNSNPKLFWSYLRKCCAGFRDEAVIELSKKALSMSLKPNGFFEDKILRIR